MSVSLEPPLVAIGYCARMHRLLEDTSCYSITIVADDQDLLARHFGGRPQVNVKPCFEWQGNLSLFAGAIAHPGYRAVPARNHTLCIRQAVEHLDCRTGTLPLVYAAATTRLGRATGPT